MNLQEGHSWYPRCLSSLLFFGQEKIPIDEDDEGQAGDRDNHFSHHFPPPEASSFIRFSRSELETTDTELKAIAAEARMGLRRMPKNG